MMAHCVICGSEGKIFIFAVVLMCTHLFTRVAMCNAFNICRSKKFRAEQYNWQCRHVPRAPSKRGAPKKQKKTKTKEKKINKLKKINFSKKIPVVPSYICIRWNLPIKTA